MSQKSASKVSNSTQKTHHNLKRRSMLLLCGKGKTHAIPDEFDFKMNEYDNRNQERVSKEGSNKCCAFGIFLPGFGKAKTVKVRKEVAIMDPSMNVMSSTFSLSFENFELNSRVMQGRMVRENHEDDSISSYFELPSTNL